MEAAVIQVRGENDLEGGRSGRGAVATLQVYFEKNTQWGLLTSEEKRDTKVKDDAPGFGPEQPGGWGAP